jgi:non-specific protein-tyrosine kinase
MVGLGGGVVFAFLAENLDSSLYTRNQIEQASGLLTLAEVPATRSAKRNVFVNGNSVDGEAFRQLRTKLFVIERESNLKTLLVTSAEPHEGKSTIIANLALTLAHAGRKVVVIDGDMRRPRQHMIFGLENKQGLSDVLQQQAELDKVLQVTTIEGIQVLTSGALRDYPGELVIMPQMREIIIQLREHADVVLIDAPAVLAVADASVLATLVDGVLLVVEQSRSREDAVQEARRRLDHLNVRTLGVVMNRSDVHTRYQYYQSK